MITGNVMRADTSPKTKGTMQKAKGRDVIAGIGLNTTGKRTGHDLVYSGQLAQKTGDVMDSTKRFSVADHRVICPAKMLGVTELPHEVRQRGFGQPVL
jgi:hypothetical protein